MTVDGESGEERRARPDRAELDDLLAGLITVTHRLTRLAAQVTGSTESPATWRTLSALGSEGPMRLGELAALTRVAQPTMTKIVRGLVAAGWVERVPDVADGRATLLAITAAGQAAYDDWLEQLTSVLVPRFADLDDSERDALRITVDILRTRTALAAFAAGRAATPSERTGTEE